MSDDSIAGESALPIEAIETIAIRVPLPRVFRGSSYHMTHRSTTIIRVYTKEGLVSEAYAGDEDSSLLEIDRIIHEEIAPTLIGQDAMAIERCWELARPATFDILRDRRLGLVASACVDLALWDLVGRFLDHPLWRLWGGYRNQIPVSVIGGYYGGPPLEDEVDELLEAGLRAMKFKVGGLSPSEDAARVGKLRALVGDEFTIMVDANQAWSAHEAIEFAQRTSDFGIHWFEEPCTWSNDLRAMRDVRYISGVPVCAGQSEYSARGCADLIESGAVDYCNFDSSWSGGPTEWRRVAAIAHASGVKMAHHEEPQVAAHLIASIPHGTFMETFHPHRDPIWHQLVLNHPTLQDGSIKLGEEPGLGWELDKDFMARHEVKRTITEGSQQAVRP